MLLVGLFAAFLFCLLILGDWIQFTRLTPSSCRYGCAVGRQEDRLPIPTLQQLRAPFGAQGTLMLPHGVARFFQDDGTIVVRPQYRMFSLRFRTAWPIKGSIAVKPDGDSTQLLCVKRIPWSSAILTMGWFALVGVGTIGFLVAYALEGGLASVGSVLLGLGVSGVGVLVFGFGVLTVALAYRLESERLRQVYQELREQLLRTGT